MKAFIHTFHNYNFCITKYINSAAIALYLGFNVSMENFTIMDVFNGKTHLNKPS